MKKLTTANYTKVQLYSGVVRAIAEVLKRNNYVAPVDVLLQMQRITKQQYEDWRFGRIELHCRELNLTPSPTAYRKWGKGGKRIVLRFSKSGEPNLEAAYSRHYVPKTFVSPSNDEVGG